MGRVPAGFRGRHWREFALHFPNATYEQPAAFKAGRPSDYAVGSTTDFTDTRAVINRETDGFNGFNLICTHLGCTLRYFPDVTSDLRPAPRPMDHIHIEVARDRRLLLDRSSVVSLKFRLKV